MTEQSERGGQDRIGRILALMGSLFQEVGSMVGGESSAERLTAPVAEAAAPQVKAGAVKERPDELFLVCEHPAGKVVLPWAWLSGTRLSPEGDLAGFVVSDGSQQSTLAVGRVLGLWTRREIEGRNEPLRWLNSASEIASLQEHGAPPSRVSPPGEGGASRGESDESLEAGRLPGEPPQPLAAEDRHKASIYPFPLEPSFAHPTAVKNAPSGPAGADAPAAAPPAASEAGPALPVAPAPSGERVWVISPSALARRFLVRHLSELSFEVLEARDLDDPLLPADLGDVRALFLDESLLEDWKARAASLREAPPLVSLPIDGDLEVPPDGVRGPGGAVLPRPFERAQVERVVHWLRSLGRGGVPEGEGGHGEENDTWLFADPFGASRAGERPGR